MSRRRIPAHYEQLSEFERGRINGLKEAGWANWRITRQMDRSEAGIKRCCQESVDNSRLQCHDGNAQRKHLDDFLRGRTIGRLECGRTQMEVSEELGIAQSVISRLWQRFQDDGNVSRCYSTSRPRVTTPKEDQYLAVMYGCLGHIGLYARRPVTCVPLTATHCCLRLTWSIEHALWTPQQWSCVMFSDKSRSSLQSDSRRTLIWRAPGTRYHQGNTIERHRYGGAGWLVWGGIILGCRTDLHV
ncbi:transposable element Tcb2 transposase [Trichonephila clavipes]|nr:transposable element Tcb2 transposase [Trichonephila clavipes]